MTSEEIAQKANNAIIEWARGRDKLIVAVDGYTGIGKTTLLNNLVALNPDILAVNRDDFVISTSELDKLLAKAEDKSVVWELEVTDNQAIENLIDAFRNSQSPYITKVRDDSSREISLEKTFDTSKKILVIEGVFMFHPKGLNHLWDKRIYLEGDTNEIDARRIAREKARWGDDYFPETHPDSYFRQVIIGLKRYQATYHPEKLADLVIQI